MPTKVIQENSVKKGKLMEFIVTEILSEIREMLNTNGKTNFNSQYIRRQDGNGRGNKGRTIDSVISARYQDSVRSRSIPLFVEVKNLGRYWVKGTVFKTKFLDKVKDTNKKLRKLKLKNTPFVFVGHFKLNKNQKKKLIEKGVKWLVMGDGDLKLYSTQEQIDEYRINLRCEIFPMLDMIYSNLLKNTASHYRVNIIDEYTITLEDEKGSFRIINLQEIKQYGNCFIGKKPIDFFSWWRTQDGIVTLLHPWIDVDYGYNSEKIKDVEAKIMDGCGLGMLIWKSNNLKN